MEVGIGNAECGIKRRWGGVEGGIFRFGIWDCGLRNVKSESSLRPIGAIGPTPRRERIGHGA